MNPVPPPATEVILRSLQSSYVRWLSVKPVKKRAGLLQHGPTMISLSEVESWYLLIMNNSHQGSGLADVRWGFHMVPRGNGYDVALY